MSHERYSNKTNDRRSTHSSEDMEEASRAVENEMNAVRALKRTSIGNALSNFDPRFYDNTEIDEFSYANEPASPDSEYFEAEEDFADNLSRGSDTTLNEEDFNDKVDVSKLLWVPATSHPNISPDKFREHVQSTVDELSDRLKYDPHRKSKTPSIQELTTELEKLSHLAGLGSDDAVTLARSLSSNEEVLSQDEVIQLPGNTQLKRNKWTTYRKKDSSSRGSSLKQDSKNTSRSNSIRKTSWNWLKEKTSSSSNSSDLSDSSDECLEPKKKTSSNHLRNRHGSFTGEESIVGSKSPDEKSATEKDAKQNTTEKLADEKTPNDKTTSEKTTSEKTTSEKTTSEKPNNKITKFFRKRSKSERKTSSSDEVKDHTSQESDASTKQEPLEMETLKPKEHPKALVPSPDKENKPLSIDSLKASLKIQDRDHLRPNSPITYQESAIGFPLPPASHATLVMLDHRFQYHVERAIYRLSHLKLAEPRRALREQVLLSNFMYAYLNLVNHTLHLQQMESSMGSLQE